MWHAWCRGSLWNKQKSGPSAFLDKGKHVICSFSWRFVFNVCTPHGALSLWFISNWKWTYLKLRTWVQIHSKTLRGMLWKKNQWQGGVMQHNIKLLLLYQSWSFSRHLLHCFIPFIMIIFQQFFITIIYL